MYQYFTNFITKVVKSGAKMVDFRPFAALAKFTGICTVELADLNAQKTSPYAEHRGMNFMNRFLSLRVIQQLRLDNRLSIAMPQGLDHRGLRPLSRMYRGNKHHLR